MSHYDRTYFEYQKKTGEFAATAMKSFFQPFIKPTDNLLDFGCGGGFLLKALTAKEKLGIEINESAIEFARLSGINVVNNIEDVPEKWADVLISNHALEHTPHPLKILNQLKKKIKSGGMVIFIVPHETKYAYNPNDLNKHLYTWSEMSLGNLFEEAGFSVIQSKEIIHRFPPHKEKIVKHFGWNAFHKIAHMYGIWIRYRHMTQIRIVATN